MTDDTSGLLASLYNQTRAALQRDIAAADSLPALLALAQTSLQHTSRTVEVVLAASGLATGCTAGCSFCCWLRIDAQAHEILLLARYIRAHWSEGGIATLLAQARLSSPSEKDDSMARTQRPCVLLKDGMCQVYPVRPGACRRYYSKAVSECHRLWMDASAEGTVEYPLISDTGRAVGGAVNHSFAMAGFDDSYYELTAALVEALEDRDCEERWLQHTKVFSSPSLTPPRAPRPPVP